VTELPSAATIAIASTNSGKAISMSVTRPATASSRPWKYPIAAPVTAPIASDSSTAAKAMARSSRVAATTRENTSRPSRSVPNQCAMDGGCSATAVSVAIGSNGTSHGPSTAQVARTASSSKAARLTGFSAST